MKSKRLSLEVIFLLILFIFVFPNYSFSIELDEINNFSYYLSSYKDKVTLKNGVFRQYSSTDNTINVLIDKYELKDLNFDGINDAVVILAVNYGGSKTFYELTVLLSNGKDIIQTNSVVLGDRIKIEKVVAYPPAWHFLVGLPYAEITIFTIAHKDSDALAFPTEEDIICYALDGKKLIPCERIPVVKKPALYLYPEKEQEVKIKLAPRGIITKTIPSYKDKWIVKATPDGKINSQYDYLFYEVNLVKPYSATDIGWVVPYSQLSAWFDIYLSKIGLNKREIKDFKDYWLNELKPYEYYEIRLIDEKFIEENLKVNINPKPDTFIRVFLHFKGTDSPQKLIEPQITKKERKGFTAVEWGGILWKLK